MGRKKLEIKPIEGKSARQVTFSKRRGGLLKKAKELSILCDLEIGVVIFSCRGKLYHYCSKNSLTEILQRYQTRIETESNPSSNVRETQAQNSKYSHYISCKELLQIVERELNGELSATDFIHLEKQFEDALIQTRETKTKLLLDSIKSLHEKEKMLEEEKIMLQGKIGGSKRKKKASIDLNVAPAVEASRNEE